MTTKARIVLDDCKVALSGFTEGIQGAEWRIKWVSIVALLRAVGHVLKNVDNNRKIDPILSKIIEEQWELLKKSKPMPEIFWEFIEKERNNILKQYEIGAGQGVTINLGNKVSTYSYTVTSGPYKGRDQREVIREAIQWWEGYLDNIDKIARNAT